MVQQLILAALAIIMFSLGLTLSRRDFGQVLRVPRALMAGLVAQLILLPALAWLLAVSWSLPPAMQVGLVLIACCPGGVTSNYLSYIARGDVALSVTLTVCGSLLVLFTLPLYMSLSSQWFTVDTATEVRLEPLTLIKSLLMLSVLPVVLGMLCHWLAPAGWRRWLQKMPLLAALLFALVIGQAWYSQWGALQQHFVQVGPLVLLLNIGSYSLGLVTARFAGLNAHQQATIAIETGIQNGALAVGLAGWLFPDPTVAIPAAVYSAVMVIMGLVLVVRYRWVGRHRLQTDAL